MSQHPTRAVTKVRKKTSFGRNMALTIMTGGIWLVIWPLNWMWHRFGPRKTESVTYYR